MIEQIEFFTNWKLSDVLGFAIVLFFQFPLSDVRNLQQTRKPENKRPSANFAPKKQNLALNTKILRKIFQILKMV